MDKKGLYYNLVVAQIKVCNKDKEEIVSGLVLSKYKTYINLLMFTLKHNLDRKIILTIMKTVKKYLKIVYCVKKTI